MMSFEELITYAFDSSYAAKQTTKFELTKEAPEYSLNKKQTAAMVQSLFQIASNAEVAAQKAEALLQQKSFNISNKNNEQILTLETQDGDFRVSLFIPKNNSLAPEAFAEKELQNAKALASFTKSYLQNLVTAPENIQLQKIRAFRSAQRNFIESL